MGISTIALFRKSVENDSENMFWILGKQGKNNPIYVRRSEQERNQFLTKSCETETKLKTKIIMELWDLLCL